MKGLWASVLLITTSPVLAAGQAACVLPVADGQGPTPSKPSFSGEIVKVSPGLVIVSVSPESKLTEFRINDKTELFTDYGGLVSKQELSPGLKASVWYVGCDVSKAGSPPAAAVVMLNSPR